MTDAKRIAARVFRLESHLLDQELDGTIDGFVEQLNITRFAEELKTLLKLYLLANYVSSGATAGMKLYNMNYCDASLKEIDIAPRQKLVALTALNLTSSYILKRCQSLERLLQNTCLKGLNITWLTIDNLTLLVKSLNVMNFFIFLKDGLYLTLPERILGLVPVISHENHFNNSRMNRMQMDLMYRDVIFKAVAEFLTAIIPIINVEQIKNRLSSLTGTMPDLRSDMKLADKIRQDTTRCAICLKQPFNPYIIGCKHVFCYYCMQSKYLSDRSMGYACIPCRYSTDDKSNIRRYKSLNHNE
jgi:peroxin-2